MNIKPDGKRMWIESVVLENGKLTVTLKERSQRFYSAWPPDTSEPDIAHAIHFEAAAPIAACPMATQPWNPLWASPPNDPSSATRP
jgi:hypothetical protein